jgi:hypothetical protein
MSNRTSFTRTLLGNRNNKILALVLVLTVSTIAIATIGFRAHGALACTPVQTSRGLLTYAMLDYGGPSSIDATGCDIGDYITTSMSVGPLTVHDANEYGIFVDGGGLVSGGPITVSITGATVFNIGAHSGTCTAPATTPPCTFSPNGVQLGVGIFFESGPVTGVVCPLCIPHPVSGTVDSSSVSSYQKGGIVVNHNSNVTTVGNTITGLGPAEFIAQNGIQYSRDAMGVIRDNAVSNNFYTGTAGLLSDGSTCGTTTTSPCPPGHQYVSTGILLFAVDPNNIQRGQNDLNGNQRNFAVITDHALD